MISKREFIEVTMGVLYGMAPGHHLRFTKEIVNHIHNNWDGTLSKFESNKVHEYLRIDKGDDKIIYKFTENILMSCQEFKWLNISQRKWDNGQRTLDKGFTIGCVVGHGTDGDIVSVETIADYDDFIDLDAAIQNITYKLYHNVLQDSGCLFCKYSVKYMSMEPSDSDACKCCSNNPNLSCNFEPHPMSRVPVNSEEYKRLQEKENKKEMLENLNMVFNDIFNPKNNKN